jgi:hypothetical protein
MSRSVIATSLRRAIMSPRSRLMVLLVKRRLASVIGQLRADLRQFAADLKHHAVDFAPDQHVAAPPRTLFHAVQHSLDALSFV